MLNKYLRVAGATIILGTFVACANFDVTNPNQPTLDDLLASPTRAKLSRTDELYSGENALGQAMAETLKGLALMYISQTRTKPRAPVDVGRASEAAPAPFVTEDSVYGYAIGLLDDAYTRLQANTAVA